MVSPNRPFALVVALLCAQSIAAAQGPDQAPAPPQPLPLPRPQPQPAPAVVPSKATTAPAIPPCAPPPGLACEPPEWGDRTLKGHTFLFPALQPSPFVATFVGIRQGVYHQVFSNVPLPFGGTEDLSLLGISDDIEVSFKITDWLGIGATAQAVAVIGSNGQSILYAGGALNAGGTIVPVLRIMRLESTGTQLSFLAHIGWLPGDSLDIPTFLLTAAPGIAAATTNSTPPATAGAIANNVLHNGIERTVLDRTDTFLLSGSLAAAQALGPMFGLQTSATFERTVFGVTSNLVPDGEARVSDTRYDIAVDAALDWDAISFGVPIALQAEYELNARFHSTGRQLLEGDSNVANIVGAGLYYSGAQDLQVGLFGAYAFGLRPLAGIGGAPGSSDDSHADYLQLVLRHVW
jgi:hypothetical protein